MTQVRFHNPSGKIDVEPGATLLQAARHLGVPVGSTCGGACACSGCHVIIREGASYLSEMDDDEETILTTAFGATDGSRLACQSTVLPGGPILVEVSEESRRAYEEHHARAG